MMKRAEEEQEETTTTVTAAKGGDEVAGRGKSKKAAKFTEVDKENFNVFGGGATDSSKNKSPLPVGYPRAPLQDITAILRPVNNIISDEEEPSTGGVRKPVTRSQGLRKMGNVHTIALSERIAKNVNRAGPSKARKKQVIKIAMDESKTVTLQGDAGQLKQGTRQKSSTVVSSSVSLAEETQNTEIILKTSTVVSSAVSLTEQRQNTEDILPAGTVSSSDSVSGQRQAETQKWKKPLSERSSVSKFR